MKLNTGASIPAIGLGTWKSSEEDAYNAVLSALRAGYKHIDTAAIYRNEAAVGRALRDSGIPREEIFLTSKLWCTQLKDPQTALDQTLARLGLDYVDLYLIHWPVALNTDNIKDGDLLTFTTKENGERDVDLEWSFVDTWKLMQKIPTTGKAKAVGVSNFSISNLEKLANSEGVDLVPAANQIEIHPQLPQTDLIDYCKSKGIVVEAYSPLGSSSSSMLGDSRVKQIADKYKAEPAQVLINWGLSRGYVVLPKSITPARIVSNFKTFDLADEDVAELNGITARLGAKRYVSPDWGMFPIFE